MLWPIKGSVGLALARDTTMRPSCCSIIVVRQSSARLQGSGSCAVAPAEPDREARLEASLAGLPRHLVAAPTEIMALRFAAAACRSLRPRSPSVRSAHPSPFHLSPHEQAQPLSPRPDKTRPKPKDFLIPNGTRIHFSIILPEPSLHALHREIARPATGTPTRPWPRRPVSLAGPHLTFRTVFLVERRLLLLRDARRGACACLRPCL